MFLHSSKKMQILFKKKKAAAAAAAVTFITFGEHDSNEPPPINFLSLRKKSKH